MLVTPQSTPSFARREAGGKGYNLYLMSREGIPVPPWVVLGTDVFRRFKKLAGLEPSLQEALAPLLACKETPAAPLCDSVSAGVREIIVNTPFPPEVEQEARQAYRTLGAPLIAVRSSAGDEDSAQHSFAGQLSSFLYVTSENDALRFLKECWASGFSARGLAYRMRNRIPVSGGLDIAVVFQEMVDSEKSGVLFTCDPIAADGSKITVNAVYGVGEGLVSGLLDADTFVLSKDSDRAVSATINDKRKCLRRKAGGGVIEAAVEPHLQSAPCLDEKDLSELCRLGKRIESYFRFPQDVEWAWTKQGGFRILQARPVTTLVFAAQGKLHIWDNSNIVESYGGLTLPLTFGFAHHVYHQVYVQLCDIMMVPAKKIRAMQPFLEHMIGLIYGRVYYNILNWYRLTGAILPGFRHNRGFMEIMMGTSHKLADEIANRIKPPGFQESPFSKIQRLFSGLKFLWFHVTAQRMINRFLAYFNRVYAEYRGIDYGRMPADEIYGLYQELEERLLLEWKAPIVNDFLTMVHFGLFKRLTEKWLSALGPSLSNDLLCGTGSLESAEPTRELIRMAGAAAAENSLCSLIESTPAEDCLEALRQSPHTGFGERVDEYIAKYGHRCMSEMKLDQKDLFMDPSFLFVCLKNYLRAGRTDLDAFVKREEEVRGRAEALVRKHLRGPRRLVYQWSLFHTRRAVRNRENTRFCRTRIYGVARAMFYGVGNDYTLRGIIDRPEDVFYLELHELTGSLDGILTCQNLRPLIQARKEQYVQYALANPPSRLVTRGPVYWQNDLGTGSVATPAEAPPAANSLKGTGACPGRVAGTAKVIVDPSDDMELNGEILVTMRTDPGWIPLYPSISGLLVERGGLLSHSAIVAREMGLPTVVGIPGLTRRIKTGMRVRFDGQTGVVEVLDENGKSV
ncbi:MAG TPA: phosphoenolpyruvate synthase [Chitinivibrionales bacterium]|nr:phosphoenolpyruvate synthase [Chitinivibrionales bacterium]